MGDSKPVSWSCASYGKRRRLFFIDYNTNAQEVRSKGHTIVQWGLSQKYTINSLLEGSEVIPGQIGVVGFYYETERQK